MRNYSRLLVVTSTAIVLTAAAVIGILFTTINLPTVANAQQEQQSTNQTGASGNRTFQSTEDSFMVQVPEGWLIQDVNNTGSTLEAEVSKAMEC